MTHRLRSSGHRKVSPVTCLYVRLWLGPVRVRTRPKLSKAGTTRWYKWLCVVIIFKMPVSHPNLCWERQQTRPTCDDHVRDKSDHTSL